MGDRVSEVDLIWAKIGVNEDINCMEGYVCGCMWVCVYVYRYMWMYRV